VINYALLMIRRTHPPSSPEVTSTVVSCSLAGAILGQLTFGYIGDAVGRRKGMIFTLLLSIVGALASAVLPWGTTTIYPILALCRFVLGLGVGGVYPLSATTAVDASNDDTENRRTIAAVFSFQGIGQVLAPLVAYILLLLGIGHGFGWRFLLAAGALPGLFVLKSAIDAPETGEARSGRDLDGSSRSLLEMLQSERGLLRKLVGAGLGWFLFDITFYGNVIFTPVILQDTFGFDSNHSKIVARYSLIVAAIGLPGYLATLLVVGRIDFKSIQIMGFIVMAVLFAALGALYSNLREAAAAMLTLYALTFFFSNFGPNVSTFCLPAEIFPSESRVKLNGIAAAMGKLGATVGAALFGMIEKEYGVTHVLLISSIVSVLGAIVTYYCIPSKKNRARDGKSTC
jgi:MFS transporter, PHS family, inorganic phosphate transporter